MWYTHTIEYYLAIKKEFNTDLHCKWMILEKSQTQKATWYMATFIGNGQD
jgi:hypothetical protein